MEEPFGVPKMFSILILVVVIKVYTYFLTYLAVKEEQSFAIPKICLFGDSDSFQLVIFKKTKDSKRSFCFRLTFL